MPHMTFDWLTAGILRPMLARHGLGLADLAASLHQGVGGYEPVENKASGRTLGLAEFKTANNRPGEHYIELAAPGFDPFASPSERRRFPAMPAMWGGVTRDGDEYRLHLAGLALHPSLTALPTAGGGMLLFRCNIPETIAASMTGKRFSSFMSHPSIDHLDLTVRRARPATVEELQHLEGGPSTMAVMPGGGMPSADASIMIATFRNDKTAFRVPYAL